MAKLTLTIEVDDTQQTILKNDLLDINTWVQEAMTGKINNAWKRMQSEWTTKLVVARSDYKTRVQRDAANKL